MKKIFRIASTLVAIFAGILFINFLTHTGNKTKGPLEDFFVSAGSKLADTENYLMNRKGERS